MIPVLVLPIINRYDLAAKMERSIDHPIGRYYVIDNGGGYDDSDPMPGRHVCRPGANLGVAHSWNLAIKANAGAPWWAFVNADVEFGPGDLARLAAHMDAAAGPTVASLLRPPMFYSAFAVNDKAIEAVGFWDESYHPCYCEDSDWTARATRIGGVAFDQLGGATVTLEGGSVTIREPGTDNTRTYPANVAYHQAKWGGAPWAEAYATPWDLDGPLDEVPQPTLSRLRKQSWS
ncbi:MAG: glycosyltransferase family 2 protein [Opitutales bacterium]